MLYKNLPKAVGLRRITLHKSLNPSGGKDTVYLLLVECSHFMDHVGEAANLLPILRGRICGYTGIYRVADCFWQQPSHTGGEILDEINQRNVCVTKHSHPSSFQMGQKKESVDGKDVIISNSPPATPSSLPEQQFLTFEGEPSLIHKSQSVDSKDSSSGWGFLASLFNLW